MATGLALGLEIHELFAALTNIARLGLSIVKVKSVHSPDDSLSEESINTGEFRKVYTLEGDAISFREASKLLDDEEVIYVKRCCCSLTSTKAFPSGIITIATW